MNQDEEHLRLLSIFHYVLGGIMALFSLFPIIHVIMGIAIMTGMGESINSHNGPPPFWFGLIFIIMGGGFILVGETVAVCLFFAGKYLRQRRRYTFCFVIACILCAFFPFGTVLGVFSILVLNRSSVKESFDQTTSGPGYIPS